MWPHPNEGWLANGVLDWVIIFKKKLCTMEGSTHLWGAAACLWHNILYVILNLENVFYSYKLFEF